MGYKLINNNSKKLTIVLSIFVCAVIIVIGTTTAFLTSSDTKDIDNLETVEKITLKYSDNKKYMKDNLIPAVEQDIHKFVMKNKLNDSEYTDEDICKYKKLELN